MRTGGSQSQEQQGGPVAGPVTVEQIPGRLDVLKWPLIAGFLGLVCAWERFCWCDSRLLRLLVVLRFEAANGPMTTSQEGSDPNAVVAAALCS